MFTPKCDELRQLTGETVLVVHHSGKDAEKGARGSSALRAAADFKYSVQRYGEEPLAAKLTCTKMKDDCGIEALAYPLKCVPLFTDSDGDTVTSLAALDEGFIPQEDTEAPPIH